MGNYRVPFWRAVEGAIPSLTLIILAVGLTVTAYGATVRPNSSESSGRCDEAGNNSSDTVNTRKQRKRAGEYPSSKSRKPKAVGI